MRQSPALPPLPSIRVFETVARLLSFRRAGEELLITQSAVSHHIRLLEQSLGAPLFTRRPRSIALTDAGTAYLVAVSQALDLISSATAEVRSLSTTSVVRVSLLPSFAANWLVSRLNIFHAAHPLVQIQLFPTLELTDLRSADMDLAIRYGTGGWKGVFSQLLASELLTPVASPKLIADYPPTDAKDILHYPMILTKNAIDWQLWSQSISLDLSSARTVQLTDYNIALQAALGGQGIVMGRMLMVKDYLASGQLVQLFPTQIASTQTGYWAITPSRQTSFAASSFIDWMRVEMSRPQGAAPQR